MAPRGIGRPNIDSTGRYSVITGIRVHSPSLKLIAVERPPSSRTEPSSSGTGFFNHDSSRRRVRSANAQLLPSYLPINPTAPAIRGAPSSSKVTPNMPSLPGRGCFAQVTPPSVLTELKPAAPVRYIVSPRCTPASQ